jgi:Ser/Thr protein kinase RdoA (MazF antagonist)
VGRPHEELVLARSALAAFGHGGQLRRVATGLDTTYRVLTGDGARLALRVGGQLDIRSRGAVAAEAHWVDALHSAGEVRVPMVLRSVNGEPVIELIDGDGRARQATLLTWLSGRKQRWRFTTRHAAELGRATAQLHAYAATEPADTGDLKRWSQRLLASGSLGALIDVVGTAVTEVAARADSAVELACHDLREDTGIINGDLGPHNTVWDSSDGRAGLFDFNDTGVGPYSSDLARYIHGLRWRDNGALLVAAALDGYRSIRPLPEGWHEHGRVFEAAWDLFLARYLAPKVEERGPETRDAIVRLVRTAAEVVCI